MSSLPSRSVHEISRTSEFRRSERDVNEGTVDHLNEAPIIEACREFVRLGDDPGIFMTCDSNYVENDYRVSLKCRSLQHAQEVHRAIIDIVKAVRG